MKKEEIADRLLTPLVALVKQSLLESNAEIGHGLTFRSDDSDFEVVIGIRSKTPDTKA